LFENDSCCTASVAPVDSQDMLADFAEAACAARSPRDCLNTLRAAQLPLHQLIARKCSPISQEQLLPQDRQEIA